MKKYFLVAAMSLLIVTFGTTSYALKYDFESSAANILDGLTEGIFTVDGLPLGVQAGTMNLGGDFTLGGDNATLSVEPPGMSSRGGLGVASDSEPTNTLSAGEGLVFNFDPLFLPKSITLTNFTLGNGAFETVRMFANGSFYGDFPGGTGGISVQTIPLSGGISTLRLTPLLADGLSSDPELFIANISGTPVPEPATVLLLGTGLVGLVRFRKKFKK